MSKSIINKLFHGFEGTAETIELTMKEHKLLSDVSEMHKVFVNELTPEQKVLYEKIIDIREDAFYEQSNILYAEAFKLGLRLGIECMED